MLAAWYEKNGSAREVLQVGTLPDPLPGPGEVRVRVAVSGVNPSDVKSRAGRPLAGPQVVPHSDGAGVIDDVGPGVSSSRLGERVWIWNGQWKRPFGTAAEHIVLPADQAVRLPDATRFEEGACLGIPALTALRAMTVDGDVAGRTVLVSGGAGAVGAYALQFARLMGAGRIITTVSSPEKAQIARSFGADEVIDYRQEDVVSRIRDITDGQGVDRIVEVDAAANAALLPQIVARDGLCVVYGSGRPQVPLDFGPMILIGAAVRFFIVYELVPAVRRNMIRSLSAYLEAGLLKHHLGPAFTLDRVAEAHEAVEGGKAIGNVTIRF
ncbi:NADPH:quinone reductase [Gellertiella hungarica]|uniref:NADPH2:quinone reductase n=1 Tax=Gellertiella hungarica TaxID=1572859 RepID=A0A7W6J4Z7_9HYPH|nr:NADPH:quinone reductase [Gellertiella hungarica]MBB4063981.1 NADPH2:quinone reductase [Gellertiella hungarica]